MTFPAAMIPFYFLDLAVDILKGNWSGRPRFGRGRDAHC